MAGYIAAGLDWDEAVEAMRKDGTFDLLGMDETAAEKMYEAYLLNTDPVYRAMNSFDDETLQTMFPDIPPDEARALIGKLSVFGGMTIDENGKLSIDTETLTQLFGEGFLEGVEGKKGSLSARWDDYLGTIPAPLITDEKNEEWWYNEWTRLGEPTKYDERLPEDTTGLLTNIYENVGGNLFGEGDKLLVSEDELKTVVDAIEAGNTYAIEKFGYTLPENLPGELQNPANWSDVYKPEGDQSMMWIPQLYDLAANVGKIFTYTAGMTGEKQNWILETETVESTQPNVSGVNYYWRNLETNQKVGPMRHGVV
jgi:hypothetical protein